MPEVKIYRGSYNRIGVLDIKKKKVLIGIIILIAVLSVFTFLKIEKDKKMILELLDEERRVAREFVEGTKVERIIDVENLEHSYLFLTESNEIYDWDKGYKRFNFILNGDSTFGFKLNDLVRSNENVGLFYALGDNLETVFFKTRRKKLGNNYQSFYDGYTQNVDKFINYKNLNSLVPEGSTDHIIKYLERDDSSFKALIVSNLNGKVTFTDVIYSEGNTKSKPNSTMTNLYDDIGIKTIEYMNEFHERLTLLSESGEVYSSGTFGYGDIDSDYIYARKDVGDDLVFEKLDLSIGNEKIVDLVSHRFFDILITEKATYLHGFLPSQFYYAYDTPNKVFDFQLKELIWNGESVAMESTYCFGDSGCYFKTTNGEILVYGINSVANAPEGVDVDEFQEFNLLSKIEKYGELDFDKTFSASDELFFLTNGSILHSTSVLEVGLFPEIKVQRTLSDYLKQRNQKYEEIIEDEVFVEYYRTVCN